jgi:competence protein ComEA
MKNIVNTTLAAAFALCALISMPASSFAAEGKMDTPARPTASKRTRKEARPTVAPEAPAKLKKGEGTVNINKATLAELVRVPGIGNSIAERILEHRKQNGNFKALADLTGVKGIGEKKLVRLQPFLTL